MQAASGASPPSLRHPCRTSWPPVAGHPVPVTGNQFAGLADVDPRAWACLGAVAQAWSAGGRWPYCAPPAPVPGLPVAEVEAPSASSREDAVVLSGIDPRFDQLLVEQMRDRAEGGSGAVPLRRCLDSGTAATRVLAAARVFPWPA